jgi:hypothetical protein
MRAFGREDAAGSLPERGMQLGLSVPGADTGAFT